MATNYIYRLILIVPSNRCGPLNAWIKQNVDPNGQNWFVPSLSANGVAPATHAWASFSMTSDDSDQFLDRLLVQASMGKPNDWNSKGRAGKKQWLKDSRAEVKAKIGVWIVPMDNDGEWDDPTQALTDMGLQKING